MAKSTIRGVYARSKEGKAKNAKRNAGRNAVNQRRRNIAAAFVGGKAPAATGH